MSGRRRLQVPKSQCAQAFRHGGKHEGQVVQQLQKISLVVVFPLGFYVRYDEDVVCF